MAAASGRAVKKAPGRARKALGAMKERAGAAGDAVSSTAGAVVDNVTQAVAAAAGFVAGTVQSVMPGNGSEDEKPDGEPTTEDTSR